MQYNHIIITNATNPYSILKSILIIIIIIIITYIVSYHNISTIYIISYSIICSRYYYCLATISTVTNIVLGSYREFPFYM